jgi:hypothetical protein
MTKHTKCEQAAWTDGFYQGALATIHLCDYHGEESLIREISAAVGKDKLVRAAKADPFDLEILKRNGIVK